MPKGDMVQKVAREQGTRKAKEYKGLDGGVKPGPTVTWEGPVFLHGYIQYLGLFKNRLGATLCNNFTASSREAAF